MVPRSRSLMTAAPDRMSDSMVMLETICITDMNQDESRFGLNFVRIARATGRGAVPSVRQTKLASWQFMMFLDVSGAVAGQRHSCRVDIDL